MSDFKAKVYQIRCRLGLRPRPRWVCLQCSPDPLAGFKGPTNGKTIVGLMPICEGRKTALLTLVVTFDIAQCSNRNTVCSRDLTFLFIRKHVKLRAMAFAAGGGQKPALVRGFSSDWLTDWLTDNHGEKKSPLWLTDWLYLHNKTLQINSEIENYNVQDRKEWTHWQLP